jgi:hypothetical protein
MATLPRRFPTLPFLEIPTTPLADVRLPWAGVRLPCPEIPETQIPDIPAIREVTPFAEVLAERIAESNKALAERIVESIKSAPQEETLVKLETRGRRGKWDWEEAISAAWDKVWRGDAKPKKQGDIESLLRQWFTDNDGGAPADSEIRKRAQRIWRRMSKE